MTKKAIFPGTFDPFTIGHQSIVKRALDLFDELIIAIGVNPNKKNYYPLEKRVQAIESVFQQNDKISVKAYDSLTIDFAKKMNAPFIIRGIRTINDFDYEKNIADINRKLSGIDTLLFFTDSEYSYISSSMIRELLSYGKDISPFIPKETKSYFIK